MSVFDPNNPKGAGGYDAIEPLSLVDRHSTFDGSYTTARDIRIEGKASGAISSAGSVLIAEGAVVAASVEAENILVSGDLTGDVRCRGRLHVTSTGRLRGTVSTAILVIDEGAVYEGELDMGAASKFRGFGNDPVPINAAATGQSSSTTFIRRLGGPETAWGGDDEKESSSTPADGDDAARN